MRKHYPGYLQRRGNSYRVQLCVGGKRHLFTVPTTDRLAGKQFAAQKFEELRKSAERRAVGLPGAIRCSELFDLFERQQLPTVSRGTQEAYLDSLKPIRSYFVDQLGDRPVDQVHAKDVSGYLAWRRVHRIGGTEPLSNRTLQKDRAVLHRIFEIAERAEYREGNPVGRVQPPKADSRQPVILTDDEYERLLTACRGRPMLALYALVLGETGLRCESEALHMRWEDVDLADGFLKVASGREGHRTKSGKERWVPMTLRLLESMREHMARYRFAAYDGGRTAWVFQHEVTRAKQKAGDRIRSLRESFGDAADQAILPPGFHAHDLRHRRVTTWLAQGQDIVKVKEALGHADLRTTMGYTHLSREHLRDLVDSRATRMSKPARQIRGAGVVKPA
ncbi:MAG: site-specific integrase [Gemmatimonadaceae bacterium]